MTRRRREGLEQMSIEKRAHHIVNAALTSAGRKRVAAELSRQGDGGAVMFSILDALGEARRHVDPKFERGIDLLREELTTHTTPNKR